MPLLQLASSELVLSKKIMKLTLEAAKLSSLAYEEKAPDDSVTNDYEAFGYHDQEPDQALTAKTKDGYCFVAFRGTSLTWEDWKQNIEIGKKEICRALDGKNDEEICCTSRVGFYNAYNTNYRDQVEREVRDCAKSCKNRDDCVIITGHSQGGAIAAVAALFLADLNPYIITFGQPATLEAPCELITSERMYRFVNTKDTENFGIAYDPVPMAPGLGADHLGNMIVLSSDTSGVAFIGLDAQDFLNPFTIGVDAHNMRSKSSEYPGYEDRIQALMANNSYPIRNNGYVAGSLCSEDQECLSEDCGKETKVSFNRCVGTVCDNNSDCDTDRCDSGVCLPKASSCMACDEDTDCAGDKGRCLFFVCSNEHGLMDNNCFCRVSQDCESGRCEGMASNRECEPQLSLGGACNENSDCKSKYCSWNFVCARATKEKHIFQSVVRLFIFSFLAGGLFLGIKNRKVYTPGKSR